MSKTNENLKKLTRTSIPLNFIKKMDGEWNHNAWLEFCGSLETKGYTPIDYDKVGLLLEKKKQVYLSRKH